MSTPPLSLGHPASPARPRARGAFLAFLVTAALLVVAGVATAAWTDTATVPPAFKPGRAVTFTWTSSSTTPSDGITNWNVALVTCKDTVADGACTVADARRTDHGSRPVNANGGGSATATWTVSLPDPEDALLAVFTPTCGSPCLRAPITPKTQAFELRYTHTWTASLAAPVNPKSGTTADVPVTLTSTSPDDRDLTGAYDFWTTPNGGARTRACTAQALTGAANGVRTATCAGVPMAGVGPLLLEFDPLAPGPIGTLTATGIANVNDAELHVESSRSAYNEGAVAALYVDLHGHGAASLDPDPRPNVPVTLTFHNGSLQLERQVRTTDPAGRFFATFQTATGLRQVNWTAVTDAFTWHGNAYTAVASGSFVVEPVSLLSVQDDLDALRGDVQTLHKEGVQLSTEGLHNLLNHSVRALGAVALILAVVWLIVAIAARY